MRLLPLPLGDGVAPSGRSLRDLDQDPESSRCSDHGPVQFVLLPRGGLGVDASVLRKEP